MRLGLCWGCVSIGMVLRSLTGLVIHHVESLASLTDLYKGKRNTNFRSLSVPVLSV